MSEFKTVGPDDLSPNDQTTVKVPSNEPMKETSSVTLDDLINNYGIERDPGHLWRGISKAEYDAIRTSGQIASSGNRNLLGQGNSTYFAHNPLDAAAFALKEQDISYLVRIREPADIKPSPDYIVGETGFSEPIPESNITGIYQVLEGPRYPHVCDAAMGLTQSENVAKVRLKQVYPTHPDSGESPEPQARARHSKFGEINFGGP